MRAIVVLVLLAAACGGSSASSLAQQTQSTIPSGTGTPDSGPAVTPPTDTGTPDSGTATSTPPVTTTPSDPGAPADAGPGTIADVPCATPPQVLWSRSFPDSSTIDFSGTADAAGNLYWVEYAQPPTDPKALPPANLVSVDSSGKDRFSVPFASPGSALSVAGNTLISVSASGVVAGLDLATGKQLWSIDLSFYISIEDGHLPTLGGPVLDLGTGKLALALNDSAFGGVFVLDTATGALIAQHSSNPPPHFQMLVTDGQGHALFSANPIFFDSNDNSAELYEMDDTGNFPWIDLVQGYSSGLIWPAGAQPWIDIHDVTSVSAGPHFLSVPDAWTSAAATQGGVLVVDSFFHAAAPGGGGLFPLKLDFVKDGAVVSGGAFAEISTFDGATVFDFGGAGHASIVTQQFNAQPGLCHPGTAGVAYLARVDQASAQFCKLPITGDSFIAAVAPAAGNLALGRYITTNEGCDGNQVTPFVIEAYARP